MSFTGRCLCGDITFQGQGKPSGVHVCHCRSCALWSGGPAMGIEFSEGIEFEGQVVWYQSSEWGERGHCPRCGSTLFFRLKDASYINTSAGFLDDPSKVPEVDLHIYVDQKPSYYEFSGGAPCLTGEEFLARLPSVQ